MAVGDAEGAPGVGAEQDRDAGRTVAGAAAGGGVEGQEEYASPRVQAKTPPMTTSSGRAWRSSAPMPSATTMVSVRMPSRASRPAASAARRRGRRRGTARQRCRPGRAARGGSRPARPRGRRRCRRGRPAEGTDGRAGGSCPRSGGGTGSGRPSACGSSGRGGQDVAAEGDGGQPETDRVRRVVGDEQGGPHTVARASRTARARLWAGRAMTCCAVAAGSTSRAKTSSAPVTC
jgi:hypothetical protein